MRAPRSRLLLAVLAVPLAAGCAGRGVAPREFLLSAQPGGDAAGASAAPELALSVGPIELPGYLDRRQVVRRLHANELRGSDAEIWAEDLRAGFARVLAENLSRAIPSDRVVVFPSHEDLRPAYRLYVIVERFEPDAEGVVRLDARWRLSRADAREPIAVRRFRTELPSGGTGTLAAVDAMSRAVAALAREIAPLVAVRRVE